MRTCFVQKCLSQDKIERLMDSLVQIGVRILATMFLPALVRSTGRETLAASNLLPM
jgi:hypothetical protein